MPKRNIDNCNYEQLTFFDDRKDDENVIYFR